MKNNVTLNIDKQDFDSFVNEVKSKIFFSQYEALKSVNKELINLYWNIWEKLSDRTPYTWTYS